MNQFREMQLTLMKELDQVCRSHNLPYILTGNTAYAVWRYGELPKRISVPTVAMMYEDVRKLQTVLNNPKREFEGFIQNRSIDRAVIRYLNSDTFFRSAEDMGCFYAQGIGIDIELIRGVPKHHIIARLLVLLDAAATISARLRNNARWSKWIWRLLGIIEQRFFQAVYSSNHLSRQSYLRISRFPHKSINFPRKFLLEREEVIVHNSSFFVPKDFDKFMRIEWGFEWAEGVSQNEQGDLHLSVWDCNIPYRDYSSFMDEKIQIHWIRWFFLKARIRKLRRKIESYWNILLYVKDRFSMARLYLPQKEELLRKHSAEGIIAVIPQLKDYLDAIGRQMENGLGLYFDEELFELAMEAIMQEQNKIYVGQIRAAIPRVFLYDDYRGQVR